MVRVPPCHGGCCGFKSRLSRHFFVFILWSERAIMKDYSSGIYKLSTVINSDIVWYKDHSPAIPFKYEYSQLFFNQIDKIALADSDVPVALVAMCAVYREEDKFYLDYGHWEVLMLLMLLSMLAEKIQSDELRKQVIDKYLQTPDLKRLNWKHIDNFYSDELLGLNLTKFVKKSDEELSEIEKVLRDVAEAVWEYTNCISIENDEAIMKFINNMLEKAQIMVVVGGNSDESLEVAAGMYGAFARLLSTDLTKLDSEWKFY